MYEKEDCYKYDYCRNSGIVDSSYIDFYKK